VKIDAARDLYLGTIRRTMDRVRAGARAQDIELMTARRNVSYACKLAFEAGTILFRAAGGSAIFDDQRIARQYRNLMAGSAHYAVAWNIHGPAWAHHLIGGDTGGRAGSVLERGSAAAGAAGIMRTENL
jgi:hypothetical protein